MTDHRKGITMSSWKRSLSRQTAIACTCALWCMFVGLLPAGEHAALVDKRVEVFLHGRKEPIEGILISEGEEIALKIGSATVVHRRSEIRDLREAKAAPGRKAEDAKPGPKARKTDTAAGVRTAPEPKAGPRRRAETPWADAASKASDQYRFVLVTNAPREIMERYYWGLRGLCKEYVGVFEKYGFSSQEPNFIYLHSTHDEFLTYTLSEPGTGGFFMQHDRAIRIGRGAFGISGTAENILAHELVHAFEFRIHPHMGQVAPLWFLEGLAVHLGEGARINFKKSPVVIRLNEKPYQRLLGLQIAIDAGAYIPIARLARISTQEEFQRGGYEHAWGIVYWMLQGESRDDAKLRVGAPEAGRKVLDAYMSHLADLKPGVPDDHFDKEAEFFIHLLTSATRLSIGEWEEKYKSFVSGLTLPLVGRWHGMEWNGIEQTGIKLRFPLRFERAEEKDLRPIFFEVAAASSREGARLWLSVHGETEVEPEVGLRRMAETLFTNVVYDPTLPACVQEETIAGRKAFRTAFLALPNARLEALGRSRAAAGTKKQAAEPKRAVGAAAGRSNRQRVLLALFPAADRSYLVGLACPEEAAPASEAELAKVLSTVTIVEN